MLGVRAPMQMPQPRRSAVGRAQSVLGYRLTVVAWTQRLTTSPAVLGGHRSRRARCPPSSGRFGWPSSTTCSRPRCGRSRTPNATHARLLLTGDEALAERTQRLADAESSCCSFFTFGVSTVEPGLVAFDIEVPAAYADVLAGLVARADAALGAAS